MEKTTKKTECPVNRMKSKRASLNTVLKDALTVTIPRLKQENEMMLKVLQEVSDCWRGMSMHMYPPFQRKAIEKVDETIMYLKRQEAERQDNKH